MVITNIDSLIKDLWENRTVGVFMEPLEVLNKTALIYLRERYPYLQMISMEAKFEDTVIPKFKASSCKWIIHDYGQAMSSSLGTYLYGPRRLPPTEGNEQTDDEGGSEGSGVGTLTLQTVETARAMIELAIEKGWPGVEIISGTALMQWAAWFVAQEKNYPLVGYSPDREGQRKYDRIRKEKAHAVETAPKPTQQRGS